MPLLGMKGFAIYDWDIGDISKARCYDFRVILMEVEVLGSCL